MKPKTKALALRLLLPLLLLGYMIADAEVDLRQGETWELKIMGGDPRDLLRGHYVRFTIDWNWADDPGTCDDYANCCVCLHDEHGDRTNPRVERLDCSLAHTCDAAIRGRITSETTFDVGLDRYYVAEQLALPIERRILEGHGAVSVVVNKNRNALLKELLVDGQPWRDWGMTEKNPRP